MSLVSLAETVHLFHPVGEVAEARLFGTRLGTVSGYFNDPYKLAHAIAKWDGVVSIYFTLNSVHPDILHRARNRLQPHAHIATRNDDILRRQWLLLDVDPQRPRGVAATDDELSLALQRRDQIVAYLVDDGDFPPPIRGVSGNGGHAALRIDLPNDEGSTLLVRRVLKALHQQFSDPRVRVDEAVFSAAQLTKVYGTLAMKGDASPERPHRRSYIESLPDLLFDANDPTFRGRPATAEQLRWLAAQHRPIKRTYSLPAATNATNLVELFRAQGLYLREVPDA